MFTIIYGAQVDEEICMGLTIVHGNFQLVNLHMFLDPISSQFFYDGAFNINSKVIEHLF